MKKHSLERGQSLLEILFAIVIFTIGVVAIGYVLFDAQVSLRHSVEFTQARFLAQEGIEALRALRNDSFDQLSSGTYGIILNGNRWSLVTNTPDIDGKFTRTITINDSDTELKKVMSTVEWNTTVARKNSISLTTYLSDWKQSSGDAQNLTVMVDGAMLISANTELSGVTMTNSGVDIIGITGLILQWNNEHTLYHISFGETEVFSVPPESEIGMPSGTYLDIEEYQILGGESVSIQTISFNGDMTGTDFILTVIMSDGTRKHATIVL